VKKYLGSPADIDVETLRSEYEALKERNAYLEREVAELKEELDKYKSD
jgi:cell division protein FtsB